MCISNCMSSAFPGVGNKSTGNRSPKCFYFVKTSKMHKESIRLPIRIYEIIIIYWQYITEAKTFLRQCWFSFTLIATPSKCFISLPIKNEFALFFPFIYLEKKGLRTLT